MLPNEEQYYRTQVNQHLLAHGFLPDKERETWSKRSRTQWACAGFDDDYPMLHLMIFKSVADDLIFESYVDLTMTDESQLSKVIATFDLT